MQPAFSIITPTYQRPYLLQRALRSVVHQTFKDFECIVVDDAGDPDTVKIVKQFNDERIILVRHSQNRGTSAACNTGIKAARGKLISILDDDDEYHPDFLKKMHIFFQTAPPHIGFAWAGIRRVKDLHEDEVILSERIWPARFPNREAAYIAATTIGNGFGLTMKRECLDAVGLYNESFRVCVDTEHLFRLARTFDFAAIPDVLVKIHRHASGQLTDPEKYSLRLELHQQILESNADFIAPYPELFRVHAQRLAELSYLLKQNRKGRKMLIDIWRRQPWRITVFADMICYEWFGADAVSCALKIKGRIFPARTRKTGPQWTHIRQRLS